MAASAKLRDWRDDLIEGTPLPVDVVDSLLAVVEAAEPFHAHQRWDEAKGIKGHPPACGPKEKKALSDALSALEEALS